MGLLAPLYIAGVLAIGLPILFHLIRRAPQGKQPFSSLMFLTPSPPTLTRRSRLTNILLLILRAAALAVLAFAFARPFLRQQADASVNQARGRRVALLVDASASMQRGDLWKQALAQVDRALNDVAATDEVGLFLFDRDVRPAMTFNEWNETDPPRRAAVLRSRLAAASPTYAATRIGDALATAADLLTATEGAKSEDKTDRQLVLISDMQRGGHVESLQRYEWPKNVVLEVRPVAPGEAGNASAQLVKDAADEAQPPGAEQRLRLRVSNEPGSTREQLTLAWGNDRGPLPGIDPTKVYVPPGRSQIFRVPLPPADASADRLILQGDAADFDNTLFVVPPRKDSVRIAYLGDDAADDTKGLRYYVASALGETPRRAVEIAARPATQPVTDADLLSARLVVVGSAVPEDRLPPLRRFAETGGTVLWVLRDAAAASSLGGMMGAAGITASEAPPRDFSLIGRVDFGHPLFAPFADPRFSDFSKIRFWKHRKLALPSLAGLRTIAWFDNGDPFLIEQMIGRGRLLIATSGWHPADSQLALSTKFVPLMEGLIRRPDASTVEAQYAVGEPIALPGDPAAQGVGSSASTGPTTRALTGPDGRRIEIATGAAHFDNADRPGIYKLLTGADQTPIAVNLAADESRTAPVAAEELEQWGVRLGAGSKPLAADELVQRERRLQVLELENKQKLWRWMIVGVLVLLAAETFLAGWLARRATAEPRQEQQVVAT